MLLDLVDELPNLRRPSSDAIAFDGHVAQAMAAAVQPYGPDFVTPMAAVAGAVADDVLAALTDGPGVSKAYVNNGGDVAFHLTPGATFNAGVFAEQPGVFQVRYADPARGVATSGWRGRSHSFGIADAVTVMAEKAAAADVAATMIANAVDLPGSPSVKRGPAEDLAPDSDLGARLVTIDVGLLSESETRLALDRGAAYGELVLAKGLIFGAVLQLNGEFRIIAPEGARRRL